MHEHETLPDHLWRRAPVRCFIRFRLPESCPETGGSE